VLITAGWAAFREGRHAQAFPSFGSERMRLQARYAHLFRPSENTEVIDRIQAAADRNTTRFGLLADSSTERAGVAAPATDNAGTAADHSRSAVPREDEGK
jgi:hypothetical protein